MSVEVHSPFLADLATHFAEVGFPELLEEPSAHSSVTVAPMWVLKLFGFGATEPATTASGFLPQ